MPSSLAVTAAIAPCPPTPHLNKAAIRNNYVSSQVRLGISLIPRLRFSLRNLPSRKLSCSAASNEVSKSSAPTESSNDVAEEEEDLEMTESSVFLAEVANLVRLVDSRDVVELELKHKDFEIVIKKHDTTAPPPQQAPARYPGPHILGHTPYPDYYMPPPPPAAVSVPAPAPASPEPSPAPEAPPPPPAASGALPMASPMSGTFYRSPAPGEPAFVKVGDTVSKGQVVCIIEAMKLMNEIEADRNGTIVDILVGDGKSVGIGTPLFSIK